MAIKRAEDTLKTLNPFIAKSINFYCILMKAHFLKNTYHTHFFNALKAIDFHLGKNHPLHSTVYTMMAKLNQNITQNQQSK